MNSAFSPADMIPFSYPETSPGALEADVASRLLAASGDVALIVDADGIVRDVALAGTELKQDGLLDWVGRPWIETVSTDSQRKIQQMRDEAASGAPSRWRQVNHLGVRGEVPIRYFSVAAGAKGRFAVVGRDLRAMAALQQRLLIAQQAMEREYVKLRQAEARYRQLFDFSSEAVLIVDAASRRITDANGAASVLTGITVAALVGRSVLSIVDARDRDAATGLLGTVAATQRAEPLALHLTASGQRVEIVATMFRQERGAAFLVRLASLDLAAKSLPDPDRDLRAMLERIPDAFVLTDEALVAIAHNDAFLEMTQAPRSEQVIDQPLGTFVGRPGIDLALLHSELREHGVVRGFATIVRGGHDQQEDVELSAVSAMCGDKQCYGISIRSLRASRTVELHAPDAPRSVEQLTELVGRVSLKEIVRESTDLIERLCIEAALRYTSDNRASAAEILGLSRQSLYSKLHRHGLSGVPIEAK